MSTGKHNKFLISLSGIDGSGKTTYAEYINEMLRKKGIKCNYVYGRLEPFLLKPFIHLEGRYSYMIRTCSTIIRIILMKKRKR